MKDQAPKMKSVEDRFPTVKNFLFDMSLYEKIDISSKKDAEYSLACLSARGTVDLFCISCKDTSVFDTQERLMLTLAHRYENEYDAWMRSDGIHRIVYRCARKPVDHTYSVFFLKKDFFLTKIGQWPSPADLQIPGTQKYRKILGAERYKEYIRGIGLTTHGVGIGAFVYLRRIFENLINEAADSAIAEGAEFTRDEYNSARMDERIRMLRERLPEFLVENSAIYQILSKGIHSLSEDECLNVFPAVRLGIECILDEKIHHAAMLAKMKQGKNMLDDLNSKLKSS